MKRQAKPPELSESEAFAQRLRAALAAATCLSVPPKYSANSTPSVVRHPYPFWRANATVRSVFWVNYEFIGIFVTAEVSVFCLISTSL
jgi:hypothetical protein